MKYFSPLLLLAASAGTCCGAFATTNGLDASFGSNGIALLGPTPTSGVSMRRIRALKVLDDGRILVGGEVWGPSDLAASPAIGRLNAEGSWDTTFADNGLFVLPYGTGAAPYGGRIEHVGAFSDGSALASGGIFQFGGYFYSCTLLVKLTAAGALDTGFAPDKNGAYCFDFAPPPADTIWFNHWADVKIDSDDSFLIASPFTNLYQLRSAVAHLDATGTLINTYATNGVAALPENVATGFIEILPDHVALAVGLSGSVDDLGVGASRIDVDGNVDLTYGVNGVASTDVQGAVEVSPEYSALDSQSRLLISSFSYLPGNGYSDYRIARLTSAGLVDTSFNGNNQQAGVPGVATVTLSSNSDYDEILGAQPLGDGHILVVGQNAKVDASDGVFNISLLRLNDDAGWDQSFGAAAHPGWFSLNIGGQSTSDGRPFSMGVDTRNGNILVGISTSDSSGHGCVGLIRIVADRLFDGAFDAPPAMPICPQ